MVLLVVQMVDSTPNDSGKSVEVGVGAIGGSFDGCNSQERGMNENDAVYSALEVRPLDNETPLEPAPARSTRCFEGW